MELNEKSFKDLKLAQSSGKVFDWYFIAGNECVETKRHNSALWIEKFRLTANNLWYENDFYEQNDMLLLKYKCKSAQLLWGNDLAWIRASSKSICDILQKPYFCF